MFQDFVFLIYKDTCNVDICPCYIANIRALLKFKNDHKNLKGNNHYKP